MEPSRGLILAENVQDTTQWPVVLQYVDLNEISALVGYQLYDMVLWLNEVEAVDNTAGSFDYDLPVLNLNSAKNNGYAFQWFAMSLALLLIYLFVNSKKLIKNTVILECLYRGSINLKTGFPIKTFGNDSCKKK